MPDCSNFVSFLHMTQGINFLKLIESFPETHSVSINHGDLEIQKSFCHYLNDHLLIPSSQITTSEQNSIRIFAKGIEILN